MKNYFKIINLIIIAIIITFVTNTKALLNDQILDNNEWIPNEYVNKQKGNHIKYQTMSILRRKSDNRMVYCIQPGIHIQNGVIYKSYEDNYTEITNFSKEIWDRVSKLAYYGYGYFDINHNHDDIKWYVITQYMIWQSVPSLYDEIYFTDKLNGKRITKYTNEMNEIEELIKNHDNKPNFNITNHNLILNQETKFIDVTDELKKYNVINDDLVRMNKWGNKLILTGLKEGKTKVILKKETARFYHKPIIYVNPESQMAMFAGNLEPIYMELNFNIINPTIEIRKYDKDTLQPTPQQGASLENAIYGIYDENNIKITEIKTNSNGIAKANNIENVGKYYIKEERAPLGYKIDKEKHYFTISENEPHPIIKVYDEIIKGKIKINKLDAETNSNVPQGQASLVGTKFIIKDSQNNIVDNLSVNNNGFVISKSLPYGTYTIEETNPSKGYYRNDEIKVVNITDEKEYNITYKNKVIKNSISILKQYEIVNGETKFLQAEGGINFDIYYLNGEKYKTVTTDINGYIKIELPYGKWHIHQANTRVGFGKIKDFDILVNETSNKNQYFNILDNSFSAYLKVIKIDSETKEPIKIANTKFKILNLDTNKYVTQFIGGRYNSIFKTNEEGIMITDLKIPSGKYKLIEITSPLGYVINQKGLIFTINENSDYIDTINGPVVTLYYENKPIKGRIILQKFIEKFNIENLEYNYNIGKNIVFNLYAAEEILSPDQKEVYFHKDEFIEKIITNEEGISSSKLLPLGNYYLIEENNNKYINHNILIKIDTKNNHTEVINIENKIYNSLKKGTIEITKIDKDKNKPIEGIVFNIYNSKDQIVYQGCTNKNGKIKTSELPIGQYYIREIKTLPCYLDDNNSYKVEIKSNLENIPIKITNERIKGTIHIHKIGKAIPLKDIEIGIYDLSDNLIKKDTTNENGDVYFNLNYGKYYYKEVKTLDNYQLDEAKYYFEIKENNKILDFNMFNQYKIIEVPNTGLKNNVWILIVTILNIIASILIIFKKNKLSILLIFSGLIILIINSNNLKLNSNKYNKINNAFNDLKGKNTQAENDNLPIGKLKIPIISLEKSFYNKTSENNNVNKNIQILKESDMPDKKNGTFIVAAHSGHGKIAYFNNLDKLQINDKVFVEYNNQKFVYKIVEKNLENKNRKIKIPLHNYTSIVLTTCSKIKGKQLIYIGRLMKTIIKF